MSDIFLQLTITVIMLAVSYFDKPATKVVLLPQADASASAVVVKTIEQEQTLDTPYQRVTVKEGKPFVLDIVAEPDVQKKIPSALRSDAEAPQQVCA